MCVCVMCEAKHIEYDTKRCPIVSDAKRNQELAAFGASVTATMAFQSSGEGKLQSCKCGLAV